MPLRTPASQAPAGKCYYQIKIGKTLASRKTCPDNTALQVWDDCHD